MDIKWVLGIQVGYGVMLMGFIFWFLKRTIGQITDVVNQHIKDDNAEKKEILTLISKLNDTIQGVKDNIIEHHIAKIEEDISGISTRLAKVDTAVKMHLGKDGQNI